MYLTLAQVRAAGITVPMADDATINAMILAASQMIDEFTRQWFEPRTGVLLVDGNDSDTLLLQVPVITLTELRTNGQTVAAPPQTYRVYNGRGPTFTGLTTQMVADDRRNPRIVLSRGVSDFFTDLAGDTPSTFRLGRQNQYLAGTFGFTEADNSTPYLIQRAALLIIADWLANPAAAAVTGAGAGGSAGVAGPIVEEETDGHRIRYADVSYASASRSVDTGVLRNQEARDILKRYKTPIGMATPQAWRPSPVVVVG